MALLIGGCRRPVALGADRPVAGPGRGLQLAGFLVSVLAGSRGVSSAPLVVAGFASKPDALKQPPAKRIGLKWIQASTILGKGPGALAGPRAGGPKLA